MPPMGRSLRAMFGVKLSAEVPIINERSKQTYYGAVNLSTQQCLIQAYKTEF